MKLRNLLILPAFFFVFLIIPGMARAATITVTQLTDRWDAAADSGCSLREAIQSVNDEVAFNNGCAAEFSGAFSMDPMAPDQINLLPDQYILSLDGNNEDDNATGDLDIHKYVDIVGAGSGLTTITASGFSSDNEDRVLDIQNPNIAGIINNFIPVTLIGMTIREGDVRTLAQEGGAIRAFGSLLTLDDVVVVENFANFGGGISSALNALAVLNSQILSNQTNDTTYGEGGGIYSAKAFLYIDSSTVADNTIYGGSGGGLFNGGPAVITNSTISGNQILVIPPMPTAQSGAGLGGGIFDVTDQLTLINSTVSENTAIYGGGGIAYFGIGAGSVEGAGRVPLPGLYNVTIARNIVSDDIGTGGGVCRGCPLNVTSEDVLASGDGLVVNNTLIAENLAMTGPDCQGLYDSLGYNLVGEIDSPNVCTGFDLTGANGDKVGDSAAPIDPMISDLQDNGGPTETHGLLQGSMAIDMGDPLGCMAPTIPSDPLELFDMGPGPVAELLRDQRNFPRPIDGDQDGTAICDIGAFEFQIFGFELTKTDDTGGNPVPVGGNFNYIITVTNNGPGTAGNVTLNDPLPANVGFVSVTPSQGSCAAIGNVIGCDLGDLAVGATATVTVTVAALSSGTFTNVVTLSLTNPTQQILTQTAQVTTTVGGILEGSGFHCAFHPGAAEGLPPAGLALLALLSLGGLVIWRRRAG